ncbi:hypothetical protein ACG2F4_10350, partial [Halalkalibaculum sp. DA3122]
CLVGGASKNYRKAGSNATPLFYFLTIFPGQQCFRIGNNQGGSPWTQLDFSRQNDVYGDQHERLFFRIDKRSGKYYFRINQYSSVGTDNWERKEKRLEKLREVVDRSIQKTDLNPARPSNRGKNESEVAIFFYEEGNSIRKIIEQIDILALKLAKAHSKLVT